MFLQELIDARMFPKLLFDDRYNVNREGLPKITEEVGRREIKRCENK